MTRVFFIVLLASVLFCSCRTVRVIEQVPVEVHDTIRQKVFLHDSTYIDRWHTVEVKGDTIFVTNEVTKTKFVTKTDTAYRYIEKPVTITTTETVEVAKPLTWWQRTLMYMGVAALALLVLWVVWKVALRR